MKLSLYKNNTLKEPEVHIHYADMSAALQQLIAYVKQYTCHLEVTKNGEITQLTAERLLYIESVDGKTFCYGINDMYQSPLSLAKLEALLSQTTVLRVSKTCLLNITYLKSFKPYPNHRLLAELTNGESILVSRKYIPALKQKLKGEC